MAELTGGQKAFLMFFGGVAFIAAMIMFGGFTIAVFWNWFVSTTFKLPVLNIAQALGLSLFITWFTNIRTWREQRSESLTDSLKSAAFKYGLAWSFALVLHFFFL
jgi:hypothetical protein